MRKKLASYVKQLLFGLLFLVGMFFVSNISILEVHASNVNFIKDSITVAAGDEIYIPYLLEDSEGVAFYIEDFSEDSAAWFFEDDNESFLYYTLYAGFPGTVKIIAFDEVGNSDSLELNIIDTPVLQPNSISKVGFQNGQISRFFSFTVPETGIYRLLLEGNNHSDIWLYDEEFYIIGRYGGWVNDGINYLSVIDAELQAGMTYYLDFKMYVTSNNLYAPDRDQTFDFSLGKIGSATGVNMFVRGDILKEDNNTYYVLTGDIINVKILWENTIFSDASYEVVTTDSSIANVFWSIQDARAISCNKAGSVEVSVTTANMHRDSFSLVVIDEEDIISGDMDFDGQITEKDIIEVYSVINRIIAKQEIHNFADMNQDSVLDDRDIQEMWKRNGNEIPYIDVVVADWFYDAVKYNYEEGIMTGMNSIQFGPYESLSRAQFALILYRMQNSPEVEIESPFIDLAGDEWYADAVLWAYENGIVTGFSDHTFRPADLITREQMVAMMYRYANYLEEDTTEKLDYDEFIDANSVSEYAKEAMQWAVGTGILTGKISDEGSMLAPWGATARAEAAVIIQRFSNLR